LIPGGTVVLAAEEMVEAHFVQACRGGVCRDVPTDSDLGTVRPRDHDRCVPPYECSDSPFDVFVTGELRFAVWGNGVEEVGALWPGDVESMGESTFQQLVNQVVGSACSPGADDFVERVQPILGFLRVRIQQLGG